MQTKNREELIAFRVKRPERRYIEREAAERGQRVSEYIRSMLLPSGIVIGSDGKLNA